LSGIQERKGRRRKAKGRQATSTPAAVVVTGVGDAMAVALRQDCAHTNELQKFYVYEAHNLLQTKT
jgi:hypothetical protein